MTPSLKPSRTHGLTKRLSPGVWARPVLEVFRSTKCRTVDQCSKIPHLALMTRRLGQVTVMFSILPAMSCYRAGRLLPSPILLGLLRLFVACSMRWSKANGISPSRCGVVVLVRREATTLVSVRLTSGMCGESSHPGTVPGSTLSKSINNLSSRTYLAALEVSDPPVGEQGQHHHQC
ncbi:hypothetical protein CGCSCA4_v002162 [Colletotrichum siamense]|uniref:Uncharacterized protein n=1 Tax=Colletotrichum siamense TaxID=690259 RepID=A0A9P5F257_COLSI|nr:hypothetical protein CGCSCA4_v002162 [Colletotrichum siamense]KAF4864096.1 hypothetical protein CGCSCA2_v002297 [Colletotrichum siamense]